MNHKNILSITDVAIKEIKCLLANGDRKYIRISIRSGGCSGLKYFIEYAKEIYKYDEVVSVDDVVILIDPKAIIYLVGSEMDYVSDEFKSGFVFSNPNEKNKCGCGSSFSV